MADNLPLSSQKTSSKSGFMLLSFTLSIFISAFLIFSIQPMFSKMVLPLLGGSPAVWNTAMVFFQASLLGGYLYAHLLVKYLPVKLQTFVHLAVMSLGLLFLPFGINPNFLPAQDGFIPLSVIVLFAVSIGYPFFALAANAPLLQSWFSKTGHKDAHDPYFLYGASNIGSAVALLSYPLLIEPMLPIAGQTQIWAMGYLVLGVSILISSLFLSKNRLLAAKSTAATSKPEKEKSADISWALRGRWILAAAIPSSLMLGVTTHITTNIAAAPFLWVLPLALYLLTFVLVFDRKGALPLRSISLAHAIAILSVVVIGFLLKSDLLLGTLSHLILFFLSALICHADLASRRPHASKLTEFYLLMSLGGVLGGGITALLAPIVFSSVLEYPLAIAAACLFLPGVIGTLKEVGKDFAFALAIAATCLAVTYAAQPLPESVNNYIGLAMIIGLSACYLFARKRPLRAMVTVLAISFVVTALLPKIFTQDEKQRVFAERSFFGVSVVKKYDTAFGVIHEYGHGDTIHNMQLRDPAYETEPLVYYFREGPFADAIRASETRNQNMKVASIGLGAGALACYVKPEQDWTFYEIDQAVINMAKDPLRFSYMSKCAPDAPVILGDARLSLVNAEDKSFDLIIVDAFTSDAIPAHLLTLEAIDLYLSKLKPDGVLFFHVSNRYTDVGSVVIRAAQSKGLASRFISYRPEDSLPFMPYKKPVIAAVVMGREDIIAQSFDGVSLWGDYAPNPKSSVWTDDYSNILGAILSYRNGGPVKQP